MREATKIRYSVLRFLGNPLAGESVWVIIITMLITALVTYVAGDLKNVLDFIKSKWELIFFSIIGAISLWGLVGESEIIEKTVKLNKDSIEKDWLNLELTTRMDNTTAIANYQKKEKALHLSYSHYPYLYKGDFSRLRSYALEFKAKVTNINFAWCIDANEAKPECYMFQYNPYHEQLRPHILIGSYPDNKLPRYIEPLEYQGYKNYFVLQSKKVKLIDKNGWYYIRTEVEYLRNVLTPTVEAKIPIDTQIFGEDTIYEKKNANATIKIKILDLNNFGEEVYMIIFSEPPLKCFKPNKIGFRNDYYESALYKDIKLVNMDLLEAMTSEYRRLKTSFIKCGRRSRWFRQL